MDFKLTDEQRALQMLAREYAEKSVRPIAAEYDRRQEASDCVPWEVREEGSKRGLRTLAISEKWGGGGADMLTLSIVGEELGAGDLGVAVGPGKLRDGLAVPVQPKPFQALVNRLHDVIGGTLAVGILDTQQEFSAVMPRKQPVEQRGADTSDMEEPGGRGGETGDDGHGYRHLHRICTTYLSSRPCPW